MDSYSNISMDIDEPQEGWLGQHCYFRKLANHKKKEKYISTIAKCIKTVKHANDSDVLIVQTAVEYVNCGLVGDDTDLLVLLCY